MNKHIPEEFATVGPAILRLAIGSVFIGAGLQKLFGIWGGSCHALLLRCRFRHARRCRCRWCHARPKARQLHPAYRASIQVRRHRRLLPVAGGDRRAPRPPGFEIAAQRMPSNFLREVLQCSSSGSRLRAAGCALLSTKHEQVNGFDDGSLDDLCTVTTQGCQTTLKFFAPQSC